MGGPLNLKLTPKTPSPVFFPTKMSPINGKEPITLFKVVAGTRVPLKLIKNFFHKNYVIISSNVLIWPILNIIASSLLKPYF